MIKAQKYSIGQEGIKIGRGDVTFFESVSICYNNNMPYSFLLDNIPIKLEFRNVKTMRLTVCTQNGSVKIAAPPGTNLEFIREFAASKAVWIKKHREKFLSNTAGTEPEGILRNHSTMYVWGEARELELIERSGNPKIVLEGMYVKMYVRPGSAGALRQEYLDKWYSHILNEAAPPIIEKWEAVTGIKVEKLYIRKMKTNWGSCNTVKRTMRLNSELAKWSPEFLEYVIVHEMMHIIERGHNRKFYKLLDTYIPGWKTIKKKTNSGEFK